MGLATETAAAQAGWAVHETAQPVARTIHVDPADPVFTGHYPGFPVLPGLFIVEHVHQTVAAVPGARGLRAVELERAKFVRPVFPGDELHIEAVLSGSAPGSTGGLHCTATVSTNSGVVAEIRLRYAARPGRE